MHCRKDIISVELKHRHYRLQFNDKLPVFTGDNHRYW